MKGKAAKWFGNWLISFGPQATVLSASTEFVADLKPTFNALISCLGDFDFFLL